MPDYANYHSDGSGRDLYIKKDNGGLMSFPVSRGGIRFREHESSNALPSFLKRSNKVSRTALLKDRVGVIPDIHNRMALRNAGIWCEGADRSSRKRIRDFQKAKYIMNLSTRLSQPTERARQDLVSRTQKRLLNGDSSGLNLRCGKWKSSSFGRNTALFPADRNMRADKEAMASFYQQNHLPKVNMMQGKTKLMAPPGSIYSTPTKQRLRSPRRFCYSDPTKDRKLQRL